MNTTIIFILFGTAITIFLLVFKKYKNKKIIAPQVEPNLIASTNQITIHKKLEFLECKNDFLKRQLQEFTSQTTTLNKEIDGLNAAANLLRSENTAYQKKVKELEANKKALIQELGGAVGREDLEYATWDLVLQTTQLLVKERDKAVENSKLLEENNHQLESQIASKNNEIDYFKFQLSNKESEINNLQTYHNNSESNYQLNNFHSQLLSKETELRYLNEQLNKSQQIITNLKEQLQSQSSSLNTLAQEKVELDKIIKSLQGEIKQKDSLIDNLKIKNNEMTIKLLAGKQQSEKNMMDLIKYESKIEKIVEENEILTQEIKDLESYDILKIIYLSFNDIDQRLDLITQINCLLYTTQKYLNCSDLECVDDWDESRKFYFWLIKKLYLVNALLTYKVLDLEENILNSYRLGKSLYWYNKAIKEELSIVLADI